MIDEVIDKLLRDGDIAAAEKTALDYIREHAKDADGYLALADVYIEREDYAAATVAARDAYTINRRSSKALETLGWLYLTDGNHTLAEEKFQEALAVDERNAFVWGNLGIIASLAKDYDLAKQRYRKALSFDSADTTAWVNLGVACAESGADAEAVAAFAKAKQLKSKDKRVDSYLTRLHERASDTPRYGSLIPLPMTPARFTVNVPADWSSKLEGSVITVSAPDAKAVLFISCRTGNPSDEELIDDINDYVKSMRGVTVHTPAAVLRRGAERVSVMSFTAVTNDRTVYHRLATHAYGQLVVDATFTARFPVSDALDRFSASILDTISIVKDIRA